MRAIFGFRHRIFYGWVIVAAFLLLTTILWGLRLSFGVFFKSVESEFSLSRAATSTVLSTYMVVGILFVVIGGWALDRYGPKVALLIMGFFTGLSLLLTSQTASLWQLFVTYSLLLAVGTSPTYMVTISTVARWFDRRRGLALGIASIGAGLGTVVMAPFATYLITHFDWRTAYLYIGIIAWVIVIPVAFVLKKGPHALGKPPETPSPLSGSTAAVPLDLSLSQAFRTRSLWLLTVISFLASSAQMLVMTHIVPHATDSGFSDFQAAAVLSLIGASNIIGKIVFGAAADRRGNKPTAIFCTLLQFLAMVWLLWADQLWMLYVFAIAYGFSYGGRGPIMGSMVGDVFGLSAMGAILGIVEIGFNTGAAFGPFLGGLVYDIQQSYFFAFLLGAAFTLVSALLTAMLHRETGRTPVG
ncbi:MAG: MFS transporter [Chloroflexota bacterium]